MTLVEYVRNGGSDPADDERLEIDDSGSFAMTRANGIGRVGRFGGSITPQELAALRRLVAAVPDGDVAELTSSSPGVMEIVTTASASLAKPADDDAPKPWKALVKKLDALLDDLTSQPIAALAMTANGDGTAVELEAVGTEPIEIDLSEAKARVHLFIGEEWEDSTTFPLGDVGDAGATPHAPGWRTTLPIDHGFKMGKGKALNVAIALRVRRENGWRPAWLSTLVDG